MSRLGFNMNFEKKIDFIISNCPKPIKWWKINSSTHPIEIFIISPLVKPQKKMKKIYSSLKTWKEQIHQHTNLKPRFHLCLYDGVVGRTHVIQLLSKGLPVPSMVKEITFNYSTKRTHIKYRVNKHSKNFLWTLDRLEKKNSKLFAIEMPRLKAPMKLEGFLLKELFKIIK